MGGKRGGWVLIWGQNCCQAFSLNCRSNDCYKKRKTSFQMICHEFIAEMLDIFQTSRVNEYNFIHVYVCVQRVFEKGERGGGKEMGLSVCRSSPHHILNQ